MFPNYCFTRSAKDPGYDVVNRSYTTKDSHQLRRRASRHLDRSETLSKHRIGKRQADTNDQKSNHVKRLRKSRKTINIRRVDNKSPTCKAPPRSRCVEFRLPPVVCEMPGNRQHGDAKSNGYRENGGFESGDRNADNGREKVTKLPNENPNKDLQESCADFFSIIHDNVLEVVQGAVQGMIAKLFEKTIAQIANLSAELTQQKMLLNKLYKEVTSKLTEQSETNLNQFKFLTQMLIDNQTIHYRAQLNKQEELQHERECQREKAKEREMNRRRHSSSSSINSQSRSKNFQQHKLCQQQQPNIYHHQIWQNCLDQNQNAKLQHQCSKIAADRRLPKRKKSTVSMPDLSTNESVWIKNRTKKIQTRIDAGGGQLKQSSRHRIFGSSRLSAVRRQSKEETDPYHRPRSISRTRCKLTKQSNPGNTGVEDVRSIR